MQRYELQQDITGEIKKGNFYFRKLEGSIPVWYSKNVAYGHDVEQIFGMLLEARKDDTSFLKPCGETWRAKKGGSYWMIRTNCNDKGIGEYVSVESNDYYDRIRYESGNYFRTQEQAKSAANAIRLLLAYVQSAKNENNVPYIAFLNAASEARNVIHANDAVISIDDLDNLDA